jgi:hypothetical protein
MNIRLYEYIRVKIPAYQHLFKKIHRQQLSKKIIASLGRVPVWPCELREEPSTGYWLRALDAWVDMLNVSLWLACS